MGYISFNIQSGDEESEVILFHAEYLNEAWLAEVQQDQTTKIFEQFECFDLWQCVGPIVNSLKQKGVVTKITGTDIEEAIIKEITKKLIVSMAKHSFRSRPGSAESTELSLWKRFANALPYVRMTG
jgi:citrate lyase alpha subunit